MRIAHYAFDITSQGGIATYIHRLGREQETRGDAVFYISGGSGGAAPEAGGASREAKHQSVASDAALFERARALELDVLHLHRPVRTLPARRVPTVRTMHGNHASCPSGSRYLARPGTPCHRSYHVGGCLWGHLVDHCGSRRPHKILENFQRIEREQQLAAEMRTLTVSRFLKEQMIRSGCPSERLHVLPSPAPAPDDAFVPLPRGEEAPHFVFLGRIEPNKGLEWLLRAAARVAAPFHLDVAGDGSARYVRRMKDLAEQQGVAGHTTFHGWLEREDASRLVRGARAMVFPSVWQEPAGLVTLEAAALGRPVIASRVGGIPEYACEEFALLASPNDAGQLAAHIETLARDADRAAQMGQRGRTVARDRFPMSGFLQEQYRHYREAIAEHQAALPDAPSPSPAAGVSP